MHSLVLSLYLLPILVLCSAAPSLISGHPGFAGSMSFSRESIDLTHTILREQEILDHSINSIVLQKQTNLTDTTTTPTSTRRMKILMVSVHPPHGGGSAHSSKELAVGLRAQGHEVVHVAPYAREDPNNPNEHYPDLIWIQANFPWDTLSIVPEAQATLDAFIQQVLSNFLTK